MDVELTLDVEWLRARIARMNVTNLDSVSFGITDLEACRRFWTDFGLIESTALDGATIFSCKNGSTVVLRDARRPQAAAADRARRHAARSRFSA